MSGQPDPTGDSPGATTSTGLDPRIAGLLAYALGWISGLVLYLIEKEHGEVRYHAAQSLIVSLAITALFIALGILTMIPFVGFLVVIVYIPLALASFALWIYLMVQGYNLRHIKLPIAGDMAEEWAAKPV